MLEQHQAFLVRACIGAHQDQSLDTVRSEQRQFLGRHAAHEGAQHVGLFHFEAVEQVEGILGQVPGGEGLARILALAHAEMIEDDHGTRRGEVGHLEGQPAGA